MKFLFMLKNPHTSTYVLKSSPHHSFDTAKMNLKNSPFLSKESDSEHYVQLKVHVGI